MSLINLHINSNITPDCSFWEILVAFYLTLNYIIESLAESFRLRIILDKFRAVSLWLSRDSDLLAGRLNSVTDVKPKVFFEAQTFTK